MSDLTYSLDVLTLDHHLPQYMSKKKAQLASLGEWTHINGLVRNARERIKDDILGMLLHKFEDDDNNDNDDDEIDRHSRSKSRLQNLLDAVDIDNISLAGIERKNLGVSVRDVPGGTISFLFERYSNEVTEAEEDL
jgi:DNA repair and recombination protein RAD54B